VGFSSFLPVALETAFLTKSMVMMIVQIICELDRVPRRIATRKVILAEAGQLLPTQMDSPT
jgi:hypothetical protein